MKFARLPWLRVALVVCMAAVSLNFAVSWGQAAPKVDAAMRRVVIDGVVRELNARYVFPDIARQVEAALRAPGEAAAYEGLDDGAAFAEKLTSRLQALTRDKHIRVRFSAQPVADPVGGAPSAAELESFKSAERSRNFGVERVERLPGNIGLIELRGFAPAEWAGDAIAAAMTLVAHTDALVFDLRRNGGGDPATVALVSSYLFGERTHLNDMHWRAGNRVEQFWTQDWVPGTRFGASKPVFVLTSSRTFSGAEEFSYNLKNLQRGTLVGETTGGGAHPGDMVKVATHFRVFVPEGRAVNPISKTNWEGTGVEPHVKVKADDALRTAQLLALRDLLAKAPDDERRRALQARVAELESGAPKVP
jgi:hypothetical protein